MAVPSKPSLRSSTRQSTFLPDDSPTVAQPKTHLPAQHLGKRAHDVFLANDDYRPTKRSKPNSDSLLQPVLGKTRTYNSFTLSKSIVDVSHTAASSRPSPRITTAVQPLADGTLITNDNPNAVVKETEITSRIVNNGNGVQKTLKVVDKRTLRSQDGGSRSKSELSLYFPNYEELISNEPKESEFLSPDTKILIVDEVPKVSISQAPRPHPSTSTTVHDHATNTAPQILDDLELGPKTLTDAQTLDFSAITLPQHPTTDPLNDSFYFKAHRRAERQEKQLRNIEKEHAQHEKVQLERLLEGLKGHDWLRVMGISGITDSEKKSYEPKRDYFVHEVRCLIDKFKRWKEEEKRRKVEKEQIIKAEDDEDEDEDEDESVVANNLNDASTPDVDALAALQLHNESLSASKTRRKVGRPAVGPLQPPPIEKPFTSFYTKPYIRQAALSKHRRGRARFAFGHPVPEVAERAFRLPGEMLTKDAIRASARSRRRARRESKDV